MIVRSATVEDANAIAQVHVASWKRAYRGMVPDDYLDSLEAGERVDRWMVRIADDSEEIFVIEDHCVIAGFASYFVHDDNVVAEFNTIYLHPGHWRKGFGRLLHDAMLEEMRTRDCRTTVLWVHPDNARARGFYENCGWSETGATKVEPSWGAQIPAIQYSRAL